VLALKAYRHLGLSGPPRTATAQIGLFDGAEEDTDKAGTG
jgi:hypothetical protein